MNIRSLRPIYVFAWILAVFLSAGTASAQESSAGGQAGSGGSTSSGGSGGSAPSGGSDLSGSLPSGSSAPSSGSASVLSSASARLIQPLSITNLVGLEFGTLVKGVMSGPVTVTVDPQVGAYPTITSSNPSAVAPLRGHLDANFLVTGEPGELVLVSSPASITLKKNAGGSPATEMTVSNLNVDVWQTSNSTVDILGNNSFTMPADAVAHLEVGGTLTVEPDDELGQYTGSFPITVSYL
jgi:hypothetical protein